LEGLLDLAASLRLPVRAIDPAMRTTLAARGVQTPSAFVGDVGEAPYWTVARLVATIRELQPGVTELMCHPGYFDAAIAYSRYGPQRDIERQALCDAVVVAAVRDGGVRLVTYAAVKGGSDGGRHP
jgi:predicted glycoside hydrolase/deacetylase ChbG (UPF0249 family)